MPDLEPQVLQQVHCPREFQDGDFALDHNSGGSRSVDDQSRPQRHILSCTDLVQPPEVLEVSLAGSDISVPGSAVWSVYGSTSLYPGSGAGYCLFQVARDPGFQSTMVVNNP